jgi:proteasome accessory factor A
MSTAHPSGVPKVIGADVELGNFIDGVDAASGSGRAASRLLLAMIRGVAANGATVAGAAGDDSQDWGRKFLRGNGGCAYIDLDHLELALPETRSAFDHVACWRAMLGVARGALARVNRRLRPGYRAHALANCSDGRSHSYGAHVSVLVGRSTWDAIVHRKPHYLAYLAAFQVSSIVFTGAGKVGSENGRPWADFQLTQRGDFFETIAGGQTTHFRPIVNTRDEPLCGDGSSADARALARLHVIFFDATLCQTATLLRAGTLQMIAAMIEAGEVSAEIALDDPLDALQRWGHDPTLTARARLVSGAAATAVELQRRFLEAARRFAARGGFAGIVPRAAELIECWESTLGMLEARDFAGLGRRLDWVLKRQLIERAMARRPRLSWSSPEIKLLDQMYASIDAGDGLFWSCEDAGLVDVVVSRNDIRRAMRTPPADTRAWTRAHLLRRAGADAIDEVDWDHVSFSLRSRFRPWARERCRVDLPRPYGDTRIERAAIFEADRSLDDLVEALGSASSISART